MNDWQEAERRAQRAHELYESGRWEDALRELRRAIRVNPYQGQWHFNLGLTLEQMGRYEQAVEAYLQAMQCDGEDVELLNLLGINLCRLNRIDQALEYFERAARLDRQHEASYSNRIAAYTQLGQHDQAELMFYLAVQIDDQSARPYYNIAQSLAERRLYDRAIWCLQRALELDGADPHVRARLGQVCWAAGRLDLAHGYFLDQLRHQPGDLETLLDLGNLLIEMDRPAEAVEKFRRVVELDPHNAQAYFYLGELAWRSGHRHAARRALEQARQLDPQRIEIHLKLAQIDLAERHLTAARRRLQRAYRLFDQAHDPLLGQYLGQLLIDAGLLEPAGRVFDQLVRRHPDQPRLLHQLAICHLLAGRLVRGERLARKALHMDRGYLLALGNIIVANMRMGRLQRARALLRRARQLQPHHAHFKKLAGQLRWLRLRDRLTRLFS